MDYLATTFSPMMVKNGRFVGMEVSFEQAKSLTFEGAYSIVGHENTAHALSLVMGYHVEFRRENVELQPDDRVVVITPNFRASEAREFTKEEVEAAGFRCFYIKVLEKFERVGDDYLDPEDD